MDQNLLSSELHVDNIASNHLMETAKWAKFLAVMGLVLSIILGIFAIFAGTIMANMSKGLGNDSSSAAISSGMVTIIYLFVAAIYFIVSLFLLRFATKMKEALQTSDQETFNTSLLNLKLVYRIMGIITIIYIALLALALIGGVLAAAFMK